MHKKRQNRGSTKTQWTKHKIEKKGSREAHIYKLSGNWNKRMTTLTKELHHIVPAQHLNHEGWKSKVAF